ncbi:hypothetical protein JQ662_000220 [Listeria monocytogenes]|nr:hypothetical protein [Listeria monocytogenes]
MKPNNLQKEGNTMQELHVIGQQKIGNYEFTGIEGGFGEGKKAMLVKDIAEIHGTEIKRINEVINRNKNRFKNGIDLMDLKVAVLNDHNLEQYGFSKMQISKSPNIYLLSERGYAKLLKILEDDTAWEIYDQLVDNYFNMRAGQKELPVNDPMEILRLTFQAQEQTKQEINHIDHRVTDLEENTHLSSGEYSYIGRLVTKRIANVIRERHLDNLTQKQKSQLYRDINIDVQRVTGVSTRTQLRRKHYDLVTDFIRNWEPSNATMTIIKNLNN